MKNEKESKQLGGNIKAFRAKQGLSQEELAKKADISRTHLSDIETGRRNPTFGIIERIADVLGVRLDELVGEDVELDVNVTESLEKFAKQRDLPTKDVEMLANIKYRGKRPQTVNEWKTLYRFIKASLSEEE